LDSGEIRAARLMFDPDLPQAGRTEDRVIFAILDQAERDQRSDVAIP
jgi:hypothetical protein